MNRGTVKGRSHNAQLQILLQLPQELASFSLLFMISSISCQAMSLTISDWFTWKRHSSFKKRQSSHFSAVSRSSLSCSVKPPQLESLELTVVSQWQLSVAFQDLCAMLLRLRMFLSKRAKPANQKKKKKKSSKDTMDYFRPFQNGAGRWS